MIYCYIHTEESYQVGRIDKLSSHKQLFFFSKTRRTRSLFLF